MVTASNWILTDDEFMKPSYRISPFSTASIAQNCALPPASKDEHFFATRHPEYQQHYLLKARHGITLALTNLELAELDCVTVLTTTGNLYVSGCVTNAIEAVCKWNRTLNEETKAIVVVHEFGTVYPDMDKLYQLGVPVIEDFAHSFNSSSADSGRSDFVIYSFPKYFPIQFGGIILSRKALTTKPELSAEHEDYVKCVVSAHVDHVEEYADIRWKNYRYLLEQFAGLSCTPRFTFSERETPSVFMFCPPAGIDLIALKTFMQGNGIECSVFYGEQTFFIPLHDKLRQADLDYFVFVYNEFIQRGA
ncbi:DegT/DnrJ/EryC1/StrS family aminotransferase [Xenorhabdus khoisanae]|uniref:DegT/DnrJ/EryC1/StrS family aminotransferase n=1 Tax=Xenorhabdus khoisanae TaxID=880157 RepID=UPI0023590049|nr:DegT/DnrJ/EryC1/StrS family aminotransferase [Xenorhabdus khoisanae]